MECKTTYIKASRRGGILAEWIVGLGIGGILITVIAAFAVHSARSFVTLSNYVDLGAQSRSAVDRMGQEIRQAQRVTDYAADRLTVQVDTNYVTYSYLPAKRQLVRKLGNGPEQILLKGCDYARFDIYQRQATNINLGSAVSQIISLLPLSIEPIYPVATKENAKIVQLTWNCSRDILGRKASTESAQFARIVIRKQSK